MVVKVERYKVATKYLKSSLDCNETFAFKEEQINHGEEVETFEGWGCHHHWQNFFTDLQCSSA